MPCAQITLLSGDDWAPYFCQIVDQAKARLDLAAYSLSANWPKQKHIKFNLLTHLLEAPARGVHSQIVFASHRKHSNTANFNNRAASQLREAGWRVRWADPGHLLHAKYICADRCSVILGSHNLAHTAVAVNVDLSVGFDQSPTHPAFNLWFDRLFNKATTARRR